MSIKTNAEEIRDETIPGLNTAIRVGSNLVEIANDLLAKQTLIDLQTILSDKFPIKLKTGKHYGVLK